MTETSERYRRLAAIVDDKIGQVTDDAWAHASPCQGWTTRDVVKHLVDTQGMFAGLVGLRLEPGPDVAADPKAAWRAATTQLQSLLDDPATAGREFEGLGGSSTLAGAVDRFICFDLAIHGWDLSRAAGLDDTIDPDEIPRLWETAHGFGELIRSEGTCGPAVEAPADADEQTRLLAYLGRRTG